MGPWYEKSALQLERLHLDHKRTPQEDRAKNVVLEKEWLKILSLSFHFYSSGGKAYVDIYTVGFILQTFLGGNDCIFLN